jgi:hypothetical protein
MRKFWVQLIAVFVILYVLAAYLPAVTATFTYVLLSTLLIVVPSWLGNRIFLPHLRNSVAAALDGIYAFAVLWITDLLAPSTVVTFTYLIATAILFAVSEYIVHPRIFDITNYKRGGAR